MPLHECWQHAWRRGRHLCRWTLGKFLGAIRLHRVETVHRDGVDYIRKRRRRVAALIIPPGNLYLRIAGNPSVVLSHHRWRAWERSVDEATRRRRLAHIEADPHSLWCRRAPGVSLRQLLSDNSVALAQKLEALRWALSALRELHACSADWGAGLRQSISHGDATAANVIVDLAARTACWIDFETRHRPDISEVERRADDLRALVSSAAMHLPESSFPHLGEMIAATGDDALVEHLAQAWRDPTVAQLAQAPLSWRRAEALREALRATLRREYGRPRLRVESAER